MYEASWILFTAKINSCPERCFIFNRSASIRRLQSLHNFAPHNIVAMDETAVLNDMISTTPVEATGTKDVPLKSTVHEKVRVSVCLAAKLDGTKLKSFTVFAAVKRESKSLHDEYK